jgi:hypothetical protein
MECKQKAMKKMMPKKKTTTPLYELKSTMKQNKRNMRNVKSCKVEAIGCPK